MKKLFTFLMLAALVTMGFAQQKMSPVDHELYVGNVTGIDRSNWYGSTQWESGFRQTRAGDAYYLVIDADEIAAGSVLEKVYFVHYYHATYCPNRNYTIHLYRNPVIDTVSPYALTPGEEIFSQPVQGPATYEEMRVEFENPYTVVAGEALCVGIELGGVSYIGLGEPDEEAQSHNYARFQQGSQYPDLALQYIFGDEDSDPDNYEPMPYVLAVYYNDGQPYVNQCDITPAILDPEDEEVTRITTLAVDPEGDAFYCKLGVSNQGMDMFKGDILIDAYITCEGATEPAYFLQADTFLYMDSIESGYIRYSQNPIALFTFEGADDPDYTSWAELQAAGFSLPFEFCVKVTPVIDANYTCEETITENNTECITVTDVHDGIIENNNTLTVSPNPASTYLNVENAAGAQISVYNIAGQEVLSVESAEANETLNISSLNAGLYIVRVANGNEVSTAKVSIVR